MRELELWLEDMGNRSLPGGVAAAAVAGAMGAALVVKALTISLRRQEMSPAEQATLRDVLEQARARQAALLQMAEADVEAYRSVLRTARLADDDPVRRDILQTAIQVPISVAETCAEILRRLPEVIPNCWSGVCVDFQIGSSLLRAGAEAGLLATEANVSAWGGAQRAEALRAHIETLPSLGARGENSPAVKRGEG